MSATDYSQIAVPGAGDKVRVLTLTVNGDTVKQQAVTLADADGNIVGRTGWTSTGMNVVATLSDSVVVAANANRRGLLVTNVSAFVVSLGIGGAAALYHGKTLRPWGSWQMDASDFTLADVHAIGSGAQTALSIEELTK